MVTTKDAAANQLRLTKLAMIASDASMILSVF